MLKNIFYTENKYPVIYPNIPTNPNSDNYHLGNIRKVLNATTRMVTQTTNYYPFGLAITTTGTSKNKYLYNGKELQPSNGYYDYGARMYDATVGRWFVVDALGEKFIGLNSYVYCANNPILLTDPNGKDWSINMKKNNYGNWEFNINFTGSVLNSSGEKIDTKKLSEKIKTQFESVFNQVFKNEDGTSTIVNATANINIINDKKDLNENSTLLEIKNDKDAVFYNKGEKVALAIALNGKEITLDVSTAKSTIIGNDNKIMAHEIGHTGGLRHPQHGGNEEINKFIFPPLNPNASNFMNWNSNLKANGFNPINNFTGATNGQIERIYNLYSNGYLNNKNSIHPINRTSLKYNLF